ncbi:MAG TPA: MFS transporter [Bacteroidota bacterium]|nr:MFS transporter [Bacteroidota bacterium]
MQESPSGASPEPARSVLRQTVDELKQPFADLFRASQALTAINISYLLEGLTYFGVVGLLAIFFNNYIGLNDIDAGHMVGVLTAGITLAMLLLGATVDLVGPRRALIISLALMLVGRILLTVSPEVSTARGMWTGPHLAAMGGILWIVLGYGIYQPACYAAVKQFTSPTTAAMGYAMLYALMNLGGFLPGLISPPIRRSFGIPGVFWVYVALTAAGIVVIATLLTNKAMRHAREASGAEQATPGSTDKEKPLTERIKFYLEHFPLKDLRFMYFIFILVPVQTLFAHNWLTLPQYCNRAFTGVVSDNYEFFVNFSPLLIFILTPVMTALTAKKDTYTMMIIGTFVMGAPTFLLSFGPNIVTLFAFLIFMTLGEAIWSARFLQWVAEIAPKEMTGIYMGIGQFPWFLTKVVVSLYSGWFLEKFCPAGVPPSELHTETMWLIYGFIAIMTPVGLLLARGWMTKGFKVRFEEAKPA